MSVVVHLCVCPYVCNCMEKNLYLCETPMYFTNIQNLIIILLWGVSSGELHMSFKFGKEIQSIKGFTKMGFSFILVGSNILVIIC